MRKVLLRFAFPGFLAACTPAAHEPLHLAGDAGAGQSQTHAPAGAQANRSSGTAEAASAAYRVLCHFPCGEVAEQALAVAEAALPLAAAVYGEPTIARPLQIHLYRTAADYRTARSGLLRRAPKPLAVTDPSSRTAHIALRSTIADTTLNRVGLPPNVLRVVAHEAFHLAAVAANPDVAKLPSWFNEGAASWAEQQVLRAAGAVVGEEPEPVAATYEWLMHRRAQAGALPSVEAVLEDRLDAFDEQERYAVWQLFFGQLTELEPAASLPALVTHALNGRRGATPAKRLTDALLPDAGSAARLEEAIRQAALSATPAWAQSGRSLDLMSGDVWLQVGLSGDAGAWRLRYATSLRLGGAVEALTPGIARVFIGASEPGHVIVEIDAAAGELRLRRSDDDVVVALAALEPLAGPLEFEVVATPGKVGIDVGGISLSVPLHGLTPNGMWGVGASEGTNLLWHNVGLRY